MGLVGSNLVMGIFYRAYNVRFVIKRSTACKLKEVKEAFALEVSTFSFS